jgi:chromate transport protein ChrA
MKTIDKLDKILTWLVYAGFVLITLFYFLLAESAEISVVKYIFTGTLIVVAVVVFRSMEEK